MSGKLFILRSDRPNVPTQVVVSADVKGLAELVGVFWRLPQAGSERVHLGTLPGFETINLLDFIIVQSKISHISLNASEVIIQATEGRLQKYSDLTEVLITSPGGHQYLDADTQNADVDAIVSIGEYSDAFIKKLRTSRHWSH